MTGRHEDAHVTIRDAFDAAGRQLQDQVHTLTGAVKAHETPPHGVIASLAPERDHGFIAASDGREIYFHRNRSTHAFSPPPSRPRAPKARDASGSA